MRWLGVAVVWMLWVRLWFQGPIRLGRWVVVPDRGWLMALLAVALIGTVLEAYGLSVRRVWTWGRRRARTLGTYLAVALVVLLWVGWMVHAFRARVPRGFRATYYPQARLEGAPFIGGIQAAPVVRPAWIPVPGQPFAVLWEGYFRVDRPDRYVLEVEAVDGAIAWVLPARQLEGRPVGWGRGFRRSMDLRPGWYVLRLALISETGRNYALEWRLCGAGCRSPADFFPTVPSGAALRRERWWLGSWVGGTLVLGGIGFGAVVRRCRNPWAGGKAFLRRWGGVLLPLLVGTGLRVLMHDRVPSMFSSDEAVYHSMMVDILEGRGYNSWNAPPETAHMWPGHPTFEYGQAYGGTLVAHLGALLSFLVGRSWQTLLYAIDLLVLVHMVGVFVLARTLWGERVARWALWLLAVPHYQQVLMEHIIVRADLMALTPWVFWLVARMWFDPPEVRERWRYDLWVGLLGGLLMWVHPSSVSILATAGLLVLAFAWVFRRAGGVRSLAYGLLGFLMGVAPVIFWNMRHDWIIFRVPTAIAHTPGLFDWEAWVHFGASLPDRLNRVLFFLTRDVWGALWVDPNPFCRPMLMSCQATLYQTWVPPEPSYVTAFLVGIHVIAVGAYLLFVLRTRPSPLAEDPGWVPRTAPVLLMAVTLWMNAMAASVLVDARYLTHLFTVGPPLVAWLGVEVLRRWRGSGVLLIALLVAVHAHALAYGWLVNAERTQVARGLVDFLGYHRVASVITNFETAYWLMWMTDEAVVAAPGYNPPKDRHSLLTTRAFRDPRSAVLLPIREAEALRLEAWLAQQGIRYRRYQYRDWLLLKDFDVPYWQQTVRFI